MPGGLILVIVAPCICTILKATTIDQHDMTDCNIIGTHRVMNSFKAALLNLKTTSSLG